MVKLLVIFMTLSLTSCKGNENKVKDFAESYCYELKDGYVYVNFYNDTDGVIQIPKITSVVDKDFYLLEGYFKIEDDTLIITMPNESHIGISHKGEDTKVEVRNDEIELEKGKKVQQLFKVKGDFKYIVLDNSNPLKRCD